MGFGIEVTVPSNGYDPVKEAKEAENRFRRFDYNKPLDYEDRELIRFPVGLFRDKEEPLVIPHVVATDIRTVMNSSFRSLTGPAIIAIEAGHESGADIRAIPEYLAALALRAGATPEAVVEMSEGFCELLNECLSETNTRGEGR